LTMGASTAGAKEFAFGFGAEGEQGGESFRPSQMDINLTGNGGVPAGTMYVTDNSERSLDRGQSFDAVGDFIRTLGAGVSGGGAAGTGDTFEGSAVIEHVVTSLKAFGVGQAITGPGIPGGTRITGVSGSNQGTIVMSQPATATGSGVALSVAPDPGN